MKRSTLQLLVFSLVIQLIPAATIFAKGKSNASTAAGSYKDWGGQIDQLEILEPFKRSDYKKVVVTSFDSSATPLPEAKENTFKPVKEVLEVVSETVAKGLGEELKGMTVETAASATGNDVIILRGKVEEMDPGSRAKRLMVGYGAGATRAKLSGELVDAKTGKVLARFTQERRSSMSMGKSDYVKMMKKNLVAIGHDVALILSKF